MDALNGGKNIHEKIYKCIAYIQKSSAKILQH